jgi:hypothetical protein
MKKKVFITGVCGTIGEVLANYFIENDAIVYGVDYQETQLAMMNKRIDSSVFYPVPMDFTSPDCLKYIEAIQPDILIHGASLKMTNFCEDFAEYYYSKNVVKTKIFIESVLPLVKERVIFISSDEAYKPHNQFGKQKLEVEQYLNNLNNKNQNNFIQSLRFPFVIESNGSVYHVFDKLSKENKPLPLTDERITKIATRKEEFIRGWDDFYKNVLKSGVYTLSIGKVLSIKALAEELIEKNHSKSKIEIIGLRKGDTLGDSIMDFKHFNQITECVSEVFE